MAARLAATALRGGPPLIHYRDYNTADAPPNLSLRLVADKRAVFERYAAHDAVVGMGEPYAAWLRSMRRRWPWGSNAVAGGPDGLRYAHVDRGRLVLGPDRGKSVVDTPGFEPRSVVFADPGTLVVQDRVGRIFARRRGWPPLGAQAGPPAAAVLPGGRLVVAARNARGGVSIRHADQPWGDLGGTGVHDTVSLLVGEQGIDAFAPAEAGLLHWHGRSGRFALEVAPHRPAGTVAVAPGHAAFREAGMGRLVVLGERAGWSVVAVQEFDATSDPALAVAPGDRPVLAVRDGDGRIAVLADGRRTVLPARIPGHHDRW
ncbi:hypothetical protein GCM10011581_22910 [Saccharopolyspora subtropica]|uniref:Uncharacterized protein n=1 Tax=Saccharopolyspora thermophila TaxID=89367 RepID=A0A917JW18_9PSEU|nr:hypothetical protein [Saccharopolyspora subtropica]GGI85211.1 hypothetical protein GCM10011581_22910 [Saccharopolyspora subtropica]